MLLHLHDYSFQVLTFRMIEAYGMIGWLGKLLQNPNITSGIGGGHKNRLSEIFLAYCLGAAEGEQYASGSNGFKSPLIKSLITLQRIT